MAHTGYNSRKRVWSRAAPVFSDPTCATSSSRMATRSCASTISLPEPNRTSRSLRDHPHFELLRHDVTFPLFVEVDEIYNLACPASPIHYQHDPVQTTKTSVHGAINMLGLAKRCTAQDPAGLDQRSLRRPRCASADGRLLGQRESDRAARLLRRRQALRRDAVHRLSPQHGCRIKVARIFNTYGPRMHPDDGRVVSNFIRQALRGEADHDLRRRRADAIVLLCRRSDRRHDRADGHAETTSPVRSTSATRWNSRWWNWPSR